MKQKLTKHFGISLFFLLFGCSLYAQTLLKEIRQGQDGANIFQQTLTKGSSVYFIAEDDALRNSIWKTDGTDSSTVAVVSNDRFFVTYMLGFIENDLFFIGGYVTGDTIGSALYKVDVQTNVLSLVKDINAVDNDFAYFGGGSAQFDNGDILFFANDGVNGFEPWITDGTTAGTRLVKDINPVSNSLLGTSPIGYFAKLNNVIYFGAGRDSDGAELWKSDGTTTGTVLVKDIETDNSFGNYQFGSNPSFLTVFNGKVYFSANTQTFGRELWVTDGTNAGTQQVVDFSAGNTNPENLIVYDGSLYYRGFTNNDGATLIKSNGSASGTSIVQRPSLGGVDFPEELVVFKNKLYMSGSDDNGAYAIFSSSGGSFTKDITTDRAFNLLATSNYLYYKSYDSNSFVNLFRTDGTATQTKINTSSTIEIDDQKPMQFINSCLLFSATNSTSGQELFSICNQQSQPLAVSEVIGLNDMTISVYPNPSTGKFTIESEEVGLATITLFGIDGRIVFEIKENTLANNRAKIVLSDSLIAGLYVLMIQASDGNRFKKNISIVR